MFVFWLVAFLLSSDIACGQCEKALTMEEAEQIAIANNLPLEQAFLRAERDYWIYREILGRYLPSLSFNEIWKRSSLLPTSDAIFGSTFINTNSSIWRVDQLILSLPTYYDIGSADWTHAASFFDYLELLVRTTADIRNAHMRVIATKQLINITQKILDLFKESYENDAIRVEVGDATLFEFNRNKLAYTNTLSEYYRNVIEYENAKTEWVKLLGIDPTEGYTYDVAEQNLPIEEIEFIEAIQQRVKGAPLQVTGDIFNNNEISNWKLIAAFQRPLLKKTDADFRSADMRVRSTWGNYVPEVSFFTTYNSNSPPEFFSTRRDFQETGVALSWRIFDGTQRESRLRRFCKERAIFKSVEIESWYTVQLEIETRIYQFQEALYAYRASIEGRKLAQEGLAFAQELFLQGDITAIDYRDMIQSLGRANADLVEAKLVLISSYFNLLAALGLQDANAGIYLLTQECPPSSDLDDIDFSE